MYAQHQPIISTWARSHPNNLARVLQFCIISQRQRFYNVPALMDDAERPPEDGSSALWGFKVRAYSEAWEGREEIHWHCEEIMNWPGVDQPSNLLNYLASQYGLNLAKAGFACQLAYGVSGCLDIVNVERLGLPKRLFPNHGQLKTPTARWKRVRKYNALVTEAGGTERLWDDWCIAMTARYPAAFLSADKVSALHLKCLGVT